MISAPAALIETRDGSNIFGLSGLAKHVDQNPFMAAFVMRLLKESMSRSSRLAKVTHASWDKTESEFSHEAGNRFALIFNGRVRVPPNRAHPVVVFVGYLVEVGAREPWPLVESDPSAPPVFRPDELSPSAKLFQQRSRL
ncbi:MAG: hypothetical protein JO249_13365 [Acidobacteria bacterium]|nr:hypothetical protein [Acidobacteriota bacterium]